MKRRMRIAVFYICVRALLFAPGDWASAAEPFFFVQLSDRQFGMFTDNADMVPEAANFEFVVATLNRLRPAFVVVTGDIDP